MTKEELDNFAARIESESLGFSRITNDDLVCRDCVFAMDDTEILGNTSRCQQFPSKPGRVITGGTCPYHRSK